MGTKTKLYLVTFKTGGGVGSLFVEAKGSFNLKDSDDLVKKLSNKHGFISIISMTLVDEYLTADVTLKGEKNNE
ncbi:hypothetical protein [Bacteroides sp.]|uniref:hypothetical protein n=1 Tax=Bacteroides sp. TaxID=29523 RepID=UPI00260FBD66|nr:hypothetical protein [Bacteroides sp.]MDD3039739.1 hypothetical protein [Bacteroides sp.]